MELTASEWLIAIPVCLMALAVLYEFIAPVVKDELDRRRPKPAYAAIAGPPFSVTGSLLYLDRPASLAVEVAVAEPEVKLRATPRGRRSPLAERL